MELECKELGKFEFENCMIRKCENWKENNGKKELGNWNDKEIRYRGVGGIKGIGRWANLIERIRSETERER